MVEPHVGLGPGTPPAGVRSGRQSPITASRPGNLAAMVRPRLCARPGCSEPAVATLVFQYTNRTAWIEDLREPEPATMDLCQLHADRQGAPRGWTGEDRRGKTLALAPPPPTEIGITEAEEPTAGPAAASAQAEAS